MKPGDLVQYVETPALYGRMLFIRVLPNGLLECLVCPDTWHAVSEYFEPREVELASALESGGLVA